MKHKLPRFARTVQGRRQIKIYTAADDWCLAQCNYWNQRTEHIGALLLPEDDPKVYDWSCVRHADVVVLQRNRYPVRQIEKLGAQLVTAGAASIYVVYYSGAEIRADWYLQPGGASHAA